MNHIADKIPAGVFTGEGEKTHRRSRRADYLVALSMPVYSVLAFGGIGGKAQLITTFAVAAVTYLLTIYVFYGAIRLAYERSTSVLWGGLLAGAVTGFMILGLDGIWAVISSWGMFFFAGVTAGRMNIQRAKQQRIYILSATLVALFLITQFLPLWPQMRQLTENAIQTVLSDGEQSLKAMGYSAESARDNVAYAGKIFAALVRLIPATTIMSGLMQFSIAYLFFLYGLARKDPKERRLAPFTGWKVPFGVTPVVLVAILVRFWGGETPALVADNILAILAVYYCVTGLALVEYFLLKLNLSRIFRVLFYVMLFFSQLLGFLLAVLLGFIDSFADWRKLQRTEPAGA